DPVEPSQDRRGVQPRPHDGDVRRAEDQPAPRRASRRLQPGDRADDPDQAPGSSRLRSVLWITPPPEVRTTRGGFAESSQRPSTTCHSRTAAATPATSHPQDCPATSQPLTCTNTVHPQVPQALLLLRVLTGAQRLDRPPDPLGGESTP